MSSLRNKSVKLAVIPNISKDLRDPRVVHRLKRAQECKKIEPTAELAPIESEPEDYRDYTASWQDDYADAVGISRTKEL